MKQTYTIGVDFGLLSGRALLVETESGKEIASSVFKYPNGIMEECLPDENTKLGPDWALQHPQDYLDVLAHTIPAVLAESGVLADDVIGVGIDFAAGTVLPVKQDGTPLCFLPDFVHEPHAYVKSSEHRAAHSYAKRITRLAAERGERFLARYGGRLLPESEIPKVWQIAEEAPEVYDAMDRFVEAADWVVWQLTGAETRSLFAAGHQGLWSKRDGFPSPAFFKALHPKLEYYAEEKAGDALCPAGHKAGVISARAAEMTGLKVGTAVAAANFDTFASLPAVGVTEAGKLLMILGPSTRDILLSAEGPQVPGICGAAENGVVEGYVEYEAGQSGVGDHFDWFVKNCVPESYYREASALDMNIHQLLRAKAEKKRPGASGLLALDWWNGCRSMPDGDSLSGMMLGLNLNTRPEEIYRALIEATAYGQRNILETFRESGVPVKELFASGSIAEKDAFLMQIYADVMNLEIRISASPQTPALGSAMFAAVAAGKAKGGYDSIRECAEAMGKVKAHVYRPVPENVELYNELYAEYVKLQNYFGRDGSGVMKQLIKISRQAEEEQTC